MYYFSKHVLTVPLQSWASTSKVRYSLPILSNARCYRLHCSARQGARIAAARSSALRRALRCALLYSVQRCKQHSVVRLELAPGVQHTAAQLLSSDAFIRFSGLIKCTRSWSDALHTCRPHMLSTLLQARRQQSCRFGQSAEGKAVPTAVASMHHLTLAHRQNDNNALAVQAASSQCAVQHSQRLPKFWCCFAQQQQYCTSSCRTTPERCCCIKHVC
jgi:hypothetical protein